MSKPLEEDKHAKRSEDDPSTLTNPHEEIKTPAKEFESPETEMLRSMQKEFDEFKKENEDLHMAELSFEATGGNPAIPPPVPLSLLHTPPLVKKPNETPMEAMSKEGPESPADDAESSHFSLGAPPIQHSHHGASAQTQESVVDRQISILMNRLVGLVNRQREKLKQKEEKYKRQESELTKYQIEKAEELEKEKEEWEKHKVACIQPDCSDIIELNIGGTHTLTTSRSTLTKYHTSLLAAMFSSNNKLSTYKGKVFIDRDGEPFTKMVSYLRTGLMPIFTSKQQEQAFKDELEYWQIPFGQDEIENETDTLGQFDEHWCASTLRLDNDGRTVLKQGSSHGIVFLKTPLTAATPFISFKVAINTSSRGKSNLFVGLVDRTNYTQDHLISTYWKDSPSSYYWDVWSRKLIATDALGNQTGISANYGCMCEGAETEIGILYNATHRTVSFYKNSINQGIAFKNVRAGLYPALDLWFINGIVEISTAKKPIAKTYL